MLNLDRPTQSLDASPEQGGGANSIPNRERGGKGEARRRSRTRGVPLRERKERSGGVMIIGDGFCDGFKKQAKGLRKLTEINSRTQRQEQEAENLHGDKSGGSRHSCHRQWRARSDHGQHTRQRERRDGSRPVR